MAQSKNKSQPVKEKSVYFQKKINLFVHFLQRQRNLTSVSVFLAGRRSTEATKHTKYNVLPNCSPGVEMPPLKKLMEGHSGANV